MWRALSIVAIVAGGGCERAQPVEPSRAHTATRATTGPNIFGLRFPEDVGLAPDKVRRVIKANIGRITVCYEVLLLVMPGLRGTVRTNFLIAGDGGVSRATADGVHAAVSGCVASVIHSMRFPAAIGPTEVNYPFTFRPTDDVAP